MQTLNFNCSFCGKLMAVGMNLLGRNVRCPHCKQVLQAPTTAGPAPQSAPPPSPPTEQGPTIPVPECPESIFGETHDDDLFGTRAPKVHVPEPIGRFSAPPPTVETANPVPPPPFSKPAAAPNFPSPLPEPPFEAANPFASAGNPWAASPAGNNAAPAADHDAQMEDERGTRGSQSAMPKTTPRPVKEGGGSGGPLVWILLLYGVVATAAAAYLFFDRTTEGHDKPPGSVGEKQHPYMAIPDLFGQQPPAERRKVTKIDGMPAPNLEVPRELQVPLGQTLTVGSLEIKPVKIEYRGTTRFRKDVETGKIKQTDTPGPIYLLYLHLKNISDDVSFHPTDLAFNSMFPKNSAVQPYTGFVFAKHQFLGGPFQWPDSQYERQYLQGQQDDDKPLGPKQERTYVIASMPAAVDIKKEIDRLKPEESALWRVQLRQGLYAWTDHEGKERESSATCVIGVPFAAADVR